MYIDLSKLNDGFSSKLRVISFFMAIVIIKRLKKKLYIYEKKTTESPFLFTDLCSIKNFKIFKLKNKPNSEIIFNPYNYSKTLDLLKKKYNIYNYQIKRFNFISDNSYKYYIPNKIIQKKIKKIKLPRKFVGIHIRSTDREINLRNFIKRVQFSEMIFDFQINDMIKNVVNFLILKKLVKNVFICSDNNFYKKKAINLISSKVLIYQNKSKFNKNQFRQTNGLDFITELFCLSKSQIIISTVGGAVTRSAFLISNKKIKIYKWIDLLNIFYFFRLLVIFIFHLKKLKNYFLIKLNFKNSV